MRPANYLQILSSFALVASSFGGFTIPTTSQDVVTPVNPPVDVSENSSLESDTTAFILTEKQNVEVSDNLSVQVDALMPNSTFGTNFELSGNQFNVTAPGTLPEGSYDSFLLYANSTSEELTFLTGVIEFSSPIIGLSFLNPSLEDTADLFGLPNVTYLPTGPFDTEAGRRDTVITGGGTKLEFTFQNRGDVDSIRILTTSPIPEPSVWIGLIAAAFVGLAIWRRRRA